MTDDLRQRIAELERINQQLYIRLSYMCGSAIDQHTQGDGHGPVPMYDHALDAAETRIAELEKERDEWRGRWIDCGEAVAEAGAAQKAAEAARDELAACLQTAKQHIITLHPRSDNRFDGESRDMIQSEVLNQIDAALSTPAAARGRALVECVAVLRKIATVKYGLEINDSDEVMLE